MRILILFAVILFSASGMYGQKLLRLKKGNEHYKQKKYTEAIQEYEVLMGSSSGSALMGVDARMNLADCYRITTQPRKAQKLYQEVLGYSGDRPEVLLQYGEILMSLGQFEDAKSQFQSYTDLRPDDPRGSQLIKRCDLIQSIRPVYDKVELVVQKAANDSLTDQSSPAFYGNSIVFTSDEIPEASLDESRERSYLNLYISEVDPATGDLLPSSKFARRLNDNSRHDGPATFSRNGRNILYSQSVKPPTASDETSYFLQIVRSKNEDGRWTDPQSLDFNIVGKMVTHPCLSADGLELYFAADLKGGYGGTDIWVSQYEEGEWKAPKNLGPVVNTRANEAFPFMHPDGTLFYASKGHPGYGGYDLFKSKPVGNGIDWLEPENLGEPINSAFNDSYFLLADDATKGFMVTDRDGSDNLYRFTLVGIEPLVLEDLKPRTSADFFDPNEEEEVDADLAGGQLSDEDFVDKMLEDAANNNNTENTDNTDNTDNNNTENNNNSSNSDNVAENNNTNTNSTNNNSNNNSNSSDNDNTNGTWANNTTNNNSSNNNNSSSNNSKRTDTSENGGPIEVSMVNHQRPKDAEDNPQLLVDLRVVDANIEVALTNAKVLVQNMFTGENETLSVQTDGSVQLTLQPNQKYLIKGSCNGYYGGTIPIATIGAYKTQTVAAQLPLIKKD